MIVLEYCYCYYDYGDIVVIIIIIITIIVIIVIMMMMIIIIIITIFRSCGNSEPRAAAAPMRAPRTDSVNGKGSL